jgi:lysophospholipase L1-like esterase
MRRGLGRLRAILVVPLACGLLATVVSAPATAQDSPLLPAVASTTVATAQTTISAQVGDWKVWAGGDSFASGRGSVKPYGYNSAENNCDRSPGAYGPLLANALSARLTFVACAGATVDNVIHGMNGEGGQYDSLNSATTLATITVGGNDVEQAALGRRCVLPFGSCDQNSAEYQRTMYLIRTTLPARVQNAFTILARQAPNARILVVGYPYLVVAAGTCPNFTDSEKTAVRTVIATLNAALRTAVQQVTTSPTGGDRLEFVDPNAAGSPWLGHELCSRSSYVNGFSLVNNEDSFHPNAAGQRAYEQLVASQLATG